MSPDNAKDGEATSLPQTSLPETSSPRPSPPSGKTGLWSGMKAEWRCLLHDPSLVMVLAGLPLLYATIVGYLYHRETVVDAPVVVVDQDRSRTSCRLTWLIDATQEAAVVDTVQSVEDAFTRLRRHETSAVVLIPEGFERRLASAEPARMKLWIDSANMLTYGTAYAGIRAAISELDDQQTENAFVARGASRRQAMARTTPIELTERLLFHPTASYGGFLAPAVFVVALQQAILIGFALSVGRRREKTGKLDIDEPNAYLTLAGRYLAQLPFHLFSAGALACLIHYLYGFAAENTLGTFVLLAMVALVAGPFVILVSLPFTNARTPLQVLMLVSTPLFLASGYSWPIGDMPQIVRMVARLVPSTPGLWGLRIMVMSSGKFAHLHDALTLLAAQGTGYLVTGALVVSLLGWARRRRRLVLAASGGPHLSAPAD